MWQLHSLCLGWTLNHVFLLYIVWSMLGTRHCQSELQMWCSIHVNQHLRQSLHYYTHIWYLCTYISQVKNTSCDSCEFELYRWVWGTWENIHLVMFLSNVARKYKPVDTMYPVSLILLYPAASQYTHVYSFGGSHMPYNSTSINRTT